jgi:transcription initiation factor TFIID subunit 6
VAQSGAEGVETKQQVKHVLSKELQLYFEKIANALTNEETENVRETAIASLRNDPGLHQLVPYLVAFIAEKVLP